MTIPPEELQKRAKERALAYQFREAAEHGNVKQAKLLREAGVEGTTLHCALYQAAANGHSAFVRWLTEEVKSGPGTRGPAALLAAIRGRHHEIVEILTVPGRIDIGPESGLQYSVLKAALDIEAEPYDQKIMQMLLDRGARPGPGDQSLIDLAIADANSDALRRMIVAEPNVELSLQKKLLSACGRILPESIKTLLEVGVDPTHGDCRALRVVLDAAEAKTPPERLFLSVRHLVECGANPFTDDQEALKVATLYKNRELIGYLLELGLDIEPENRAMAYNPLILAAQYNLPETFEKLRGKRDFDDCYYYEALHVAAERGHRDLVYQILSYGYDASTTQHFDIALAAAIGGHFDLLQEFMGRGYTTDLSCPVLAEGVIEGDHGRMLDFLLDNGTDFNKAMAAYTKASNHYGRPFSSVHGTLRAWSARRETVHYDMDFDGNIRHLRQKTADHGGHGKTGLVRMAKAGRFGEVIDILLRADSSRAENRVTCEDLCQTDGHGNSLLEILGARHQLGLLFHEKIWQGRLAELAEIYAQIPPVYRDQFDNHSFKAGMHQKILRQKSRNVPKLRK